MPRVGRLLNTENNDVLLDQVRWCESFLCKLRGLMFRRSLYPGEGLLLVEAHASRVGTTIHMFFMAFSIAAVWLDDEFIVVDKALAKPWRPFYAPRKAARYTLEASPTLLEHVQIGTKLCFENKND
ncbi:MAG: DUF192 domain-containing protein [Anaerolineae bacterium]|nr:DUF192 domain-containing protein [Anaerolineae bacterium]